MGQFSWLDCKTGEQIVDDKRRNVYVLVPSEFRDKYGERILETRYDGYGDFGGYDIYDLVVDWNEKYLDEYRKDKTFICDWLQSYDSVEEAFAKMEKRDIGISIACYDEDNAKLRYPIKITHDERAVYEWCPPSKSDPNQGWEEYEDEEWEDYDEEEGEDDDN